MQIFSPSFKAKKICVPVVDMGLSQNNNSYDDVVFKTQGLYTYGKCPTIKDSAE